jgi:hypothetical protein
LFGELLLRYVCVQAQREQPAGKVETSHLGVEVGALRIVVALTDFLDVVG